MSKARRLDTRLRRMLQSPKRILKNHVRSGMTVLDLGCGPGFFTIPMAEMAGESGTVIAADLQDGMLSILGDKIRGTRIERRIRLHKTKKDRIGVSARLDFVLAFYLFHELPDQPAALREIWSILKPGGRFLLVEPRFRVSNEEFEQTLSKAIGAGFKVIVRPGILFSRAVLLER